MELQNDRNLAEEYVQDWIDSTIRIIGSIMKKRKVVFSDPTKQNIRIELLYRSRGLLDLSFYYRDGLRYTDMGAGVGYHKGQRNAKKEYHNKMSAGRKRKRILMKPIWSRLDKLSSVVATEIAYQAELDFNLMLPDGQK